MPLLVGAKQKGRARRREELSGFHLRLSMYLSAEDKGNRLRLEGRPTFGSRTVQLDDPLAKRINR